MSIVNLVRAVPKPGQTQAVLDVLAEVVPVVHDEQGCEVYSIHVRDNGEIWFVEKWASREDAARHGTSSPILPILAERTTPLLEGIPEIIEIEPVPLGGPKGAL